MATSSIQSNISGISLAMSGSTALLPGTSGSTPTNAAGTQNSFLKGDGTWSPPTLTGAGTPEGVVTGSVGNTYGDLTANVLYLKKTGSNTNTGWIAMATAGTWTNYTPVLTATTTAPTLPTVAVWNASYMVQGKTLFMNATLSYANQTLGGSGVGTYKIGLPIGAYNIDLTKVNVPSVLTQTADGGYDGTAIGNSTRMNAGANYTGKVVPFDATNIALFGSTLSGTERGMWGSSFGAIMASTAPAHVSFSAQIPIL